MLVVAGAATSILLFGLTAPASAAVPSAASGKRPPIPVAGVNGLPSPRLDQDTTETVIARGASREAIVSVTWGEGTSASQVRPTCAAVTAKRRPDSCIVSMTHRYTTVGAFPVVIRSGKRIIARTTITVREAARPWRAPAGWVQPAGWLPYSGGATYIPCTTVLWYFDRTGEPAGAAGMHDEIAGSLARLSADTGLTFTETSDPAAARLTYSWGDLTSRYGEAAGVGGRRGSIGSVTFSSTHWWPTDQWPGYDRVVQPDGSSAIGRGWLVTHETMHALGMDHINDVTAIMNPIAGEATALNGGDLDGLHTMYLNNPCPV